MAMTIPLHATPDNLELSDVLIPLEETIEFVPFNNHKMKQHKPSGDAFHEKLAKNKKVNNKIRHEELMKKK